MELKSTQIIRMLSPEIVCSSLINFRTFSHISGILLKTFSVKLLVLKVWTHLFYHRICWTHNLYRSPQTTQSCKINLIIFRP